MSMMAQLMLEMRVYSFFMGIGAIVGVLVCWICVARPAIRRHTGSVRLFPCQARDVNRFARALHEAGREAVEKGATVNPTGGRFLEWDEISDAAREGRRIQARDILKRYFVYIP